MQDELAAIAAATNGAAYREATLFSGPIRINARMRKCAFVTVAGLPVDVFLDSEKARNRALFERLPAWHSLSPLPSNHVRLQQQQLQQ